MTKRSTAATPPNTELKFEQALAELEQLVAAMERQALPLDQSLDAWQRGKELVQLCQQQLDTVQHALEVIDPKQTLS